MIRVCKILNIDSSNGHLLIIVESNRSIGSATGSNALWWNLGSEVGSHTSTTREGEVKL